MRATGKLGCQPRDFSVRLPTLESYITNTKSLPVAPPVVDRATEVTSWGMYANDTLGDCTIAGIFHSFCAMTAYSGQVTAGSQFTDAEAIKAYSDVAGYVPGNPATDNGASLASVCRFMNITGVTDVAGKLHQLAAFAEIGDPQNIPLLKKVLYTFGSVYVAVNLPGSAEQQFADEEPWTLVPGSSIEGGHCIVLQYNAADVKDGNTFVTWGSPQKASNAWIEKYVVEAVALVSQDWIDANGTSVEGLDLQQLVADTRDV